MKIYSRGKKKKGLYSSKDAILPSTYGELFKDVIKQSWRSLILFGLFTFAFFLPSLIFMFFRDYYFLSVTSSTLEQSEIEGLVTTSRNLYNIGVSLGFLIGAIGISGLSKVMLLLSRNEGVFFFQDFNKGVKQNLKNNIVFFLIYAVLFYFSMLVINNINFEFVNFIPYIAVQTLFFPLLMINIETTSIYSWTVKDSFINAVFIYIKNFFIYILFSSPFTLMVLTNFLTSYIFIKYIVIALLIILLYPVLALAIRVYSNKVLDRDINKKHYPEIYKMGIYENNEFKEKVIEQYYTLDSTFATLRNDPYLDTYYNHLIPYIEYNKTTKDTKLIELTYPTSHQDLINSLNYLRSLVFDKKVGFLNKSDYSVLHLKQEEKAKTAIVLAGGGYYNVCTLQEGYLVGHKLHQLGFNVFSLNYPVREEAKNALPVLKKFISFLLKNEKRMNIDMEDYIVVGFSASGHLVGELGTDNFGLLKDGIPLPKLLTLCYPVISMGENTHLGSKENLLGVGTTKEEDEEYSIELHVDENYPATFIWHCDKDDLVPFENSLLIIEQFKKHNIKYKFESIDSTYHGLSLANNTAMEGWVDRMYEFYKELINK